MISAPAGNLYIHIPFCASRCSYCGFFSTVPGRGGMDGFARLLKSEACLRFPDGYPEMRTVYLGGGTPTYLPEHEFRDLLAFVARFIGPGTLEVSMESNPGSLSKEKTALMAEHGVTRVTMGLQSLSSDVLAASGRHTGIRQVEKAVRLLSDTGIRHIGIDLIAGLPGQSPGEWKEMADTVIALPVDHVSVYFLYLEPGTVLRRQVEDGEVVLPSDSRTRRLFQRFSLRLQGAGFHRYEVSNYALPGGEALHNVAVWKGEPYTGLGAGAVGCDGEGRYVNPSDIAMYADFVRSGDPARCGFEKLDTEKKAAEALLLGLRVVSGLDCGRFERFLGYRLDPRTVEGLADEGLVRGKGGFLFVTRRGWFWLDRIMVELLETMKKI